MQKFPVQYRDMQRPVVLLLVGLFITASLGLLEAQRFGRRQAFIFEPEEIPETEFIFIRLRFGTPYGLGAMSGWEHDYPQAEHHINTLVAEATGIDIERMSYRILNLDDPELFKYPFAYISEPGTMELTDSEVENFREYLDRGGFVMVDDFDGNRDMSNWHWNLKRMYPDREMIPLTAKHPIFHTFYNITDLEVTAYAASRNYPVFYGYPSEDGEHLSMIICFNNDIGDLWEWLDQARYALEPSAEGVRLGINFFVYAMTH